MQPVIFSTQKDYKTYIKVSILNHFTKWPIRILYGLYAVTFIYFLICLDFVTAGIILFIAIGFTWLIYLRARSIYRSSPGKNDVTQWQIDETGISTQSGGANHHIGWNNVYKVSATRNWVFIWYNKLLFTFFPRQVLADEQLSEIKQLVAAAKTT